MVSQVTDNEHTNGIYDRIGNRYTNLHYVQQKIKKSVKEKKQIRLLLITIRNNKSTRNGKCVVNISFNMFSCVFDALSIQKHERKIN